MKAQKTETLIVRMDKETMEKLQQYAESKDISMSQVVRETIRKVCGGEIE